MNQYGKEGFKDGAWVHYFPNGILSAKGNYKIGWRVGYWEYYTINRKLRLKEYYLL
jgi:antitoxin component YwqK of YwqJK toxin-antitoxin module